MRHGLATLNSNNSVVYCQKHKVYIKIHHTALNSVLVLLGGGGPLLSTVTPEPAINVDALNGSGVINHKKNLESLLKSMVHKGFFFKFSSLTKFCDNATPPFKHQIKI